MRINLRRMRRGKGRRRKFPLFGLKRRRGKEHEKMCLREEEIYEFLPHQNWMTGPQLLFISAALLLAVAAIMSFFLFDNSFVNCVS